MGTTLEKTMRGLQLRLDQDSARRTAVDAYARAACDGRKAAELLGIAERTWRRWTARLGLSVELAAMRAAHLAAVRAAAASAVVDPESPMTGVS